MGEYSGQVKLQPIRFCFLKVTRSEVATIFPFSDAWRGWLCEENPDRAPQTVAAPHEKGRACRC